jgi:hypothetical protein
MFMKAVPEIGTDGDDIMQLPRQQHDPLYHLLHTYSGHHTRNEELIDEPGHKLSLLC